MSLCNEPRPRRESSKNRPLPATGKATPSHPVRGQPSMDKPENPLEWATNAWHQAPRRHTVDVDDAWQFSLSDKTGEFVDRIDGVAPHHVELLDDIGQWRMRGNLSKQNVVIANQTHVG